MSLRAELVDETLRYRLSDPERGNAFSLSMARSLVQALREHDGRFREIVLSSEGRFFCAGGQLADYARMPNADAGRATNREIAEALELLASVPRPTLALVQGDCLGGGVELLSCFDRVIAVPEAGFGLWQRRVGLSFGWGGRDRLAERIARRRLAGLALDARTLGAREALRLGLIDEVALASRLEGAGESWRRRSRSLAATPVGALKALDSNERAVFDEIWWNDEHRAVLASRRPKSGD